jgi:hypothetical protein
MAIRAGTTAGPDDELRASGPFEAWDERLVIQAISQYVPGEPVVLAVRGVTESYAVTAAGQAATVTGDDLDVNGDGTITFTGTRGNYRYGALVPVVLTMGAESDGINVTLVAEAGKAWVNLASPLATSGNRLTAIPDLAPGDQVAWYSVTGGTIADVDVLSDGSINGAAAVTGFMVEAHNGTEWGEPALQGVTNLSNPPQTRRSVTIRAAVNPPGVPVGVNATGVLGTFSAGTAGAVGGGEPGEGYTLADATAGLPFAISTPTPPTITSEATVTPATFSANNVNGRRLILGAGTYSNLTIGGTDKEVVLTTGVNITGMLEIAGQRIIIRANPARTGAISHLLMSRMPDRVEDILLDGIYSEAGDYNEIRDCNRIAVINSRFRQINYAMSIFTGQHNDVIFANTSFETYGGNQAVVRLHSVNRLAFVDNLVRSSNSSGGFRLHVSGTHWQTGLDGQKADNLCVRRCQFEGTHTSNLTNFLSASGDGGTTANGMGAVWWEDTTVYHNSQWFISTGNTVQVNYPEVITMRNNAAYISSGGWPTADQHPWDATMENNTTQGYQAPPVWEHQ